MDPSFPVKYRNRKSKDVRKVAAVNTRVTGGIDAIICNGDVEKTAMIQMGGGRRRAGRS